MSLLGSVLLLAGLFALLSLFCIPFVEARWAKATPTAMVTKAGTLAALQTLLTFVQVGLVVFGATYAVLGLLNLVAPLFAASLLIGLHDRLSGIEEMAKDFKEDVGWGFFCLALAALFWLGWRARKRALIAALEAENGRQMDALIDKARNGKLEELPPNATMDRLIGQIELIDVRLASLHAATSSPTDEIAKLDQLRQEVERQYILADLRRRVDLTEVPVDEPGAKGLWPRVRLAAFSKGMQNLRKNVTDILTKATTAIACFLVIGVSVPALAALGIAPTIDHLADVQILRDEDAATKSLAKLTGKPPTAPISPEDQQAYDQAAQNFVQSFLRSTGWQHAVDRSLPSHDAVAPGARRDEAILQNIALRDDLLREYAGSGDGGLRPATPGVFEGAGSSSEHRFDEFRSTMAGERRPIDIAVAHVSAWLRAKGERSPGFRVRLKRGLAEFGKSASAWDFASTVLSEELSSAIDAAFPDPSNPSLFRSELAKPAREAGEKAVERMARMKLVDMLNGIDRGESVSNVLAAVERPGGASGLMREREARGLAIMLDGINQDRSQILANAASRQPALLQTASLTDKDLAHEVASAMVTGDQSDDEIINDRRQLSGTLGGYDDMFSAGERGHEETALASALPLHSPPSANPVGDGGPNPGVGGGGGAVSDGEEIASAGEQAFAVEGEAARSFAVLEGSVRVGGVLVGENASGKPADIRSIVWQQKGALFSLAVVTGGGQTIALGDFRGSMIQQALAYAADGRPVATTMTSNILTDSMLKVHVHPALVNTKLGCEMIAIDRFVDESTGRNPARQHWSEEVGTQLELYNKAAQMLAFKGSMQQWLDAHAGKPMGTPAAKARALAFPTGWNAADPHQSIFAYDGARFTSAVLAAVRQCPVASEAGYWGCINDRAGGAGADDQPFQLWSGVREATFRLDGTALAEQNRSSQVAGRTEPLRFMFQVAFEQSEQHPVAPWEFPVLGSKIQDGVNHLVGTDAGRQAILADARRFTLLQRIFRAALNGGLGSHFPTQRLMQLMRDAKVADPIGASPTPQWSLGRGDAERLFGFKRDAVIEDWIKSIVALTPAVKAGQDPTGSSNQCLGYLRGALPTADTFLGDGFKKSCGGIQDLKPLDSAKQDALSVKYIGSLLQSSSGARFSGGGLCPRAG